VSSILVVLTSQHAASLGDLGHLAHFKHWSFR
jgi:hypothetical protein